MATKTNIMQLMEMLEAPEAYSEQEIRNIINCDDETRQAYRLMVAARQGYIRQQTEQPADPQAAWQRFDERHYSQKTSRIWMKTAASLVGVLLVSGIAFAAILVVGIPHSSLWKGGYTETADTVIQHASSPVPVEEADEVAPIVYDNIPLERMLSEIAAHYDAEVAFLDDDARPLRFHFVWNPRQNLENVVTDLNHFERLHVTLKNQQLIVE